jgi:hypothetical protein
MGRGGARPGSGRKSLAEEGYVKDMARAAIAEVYGSVEDGLKRLLLSDSDMLKKFVWEHAMGKPPDKVQMSADPDAVPIININVVRTVKDNTNEDVADSL